MASLPQPKLRNGDTNARVGGTFLRREDFPKLADGNGRLFFDVEDRPTTREAQAAGEYGPRAGRFGIDVPTHIKGAPYIVTVPDFTEDYQGLLVFFGEDSDTWVGGSICVWLDPVTGYLRFAPTQLVVQTGAQAPPRPTVLMPHTGPGYAPVPGVPGGERGRWTPPGHHLPGAGPANGGYSAEQLEAAERAEAARLGYAVAPAQPPGELAPESAARAAKVAARKAPAARAGRGR